MTLLILEIILITIIKHSYMLKSEDKIRPNIIFIIADDLGWNDVGFHGSNEVLTPNIDALAYHEIILNSHYSQSLCTPSRAALLTGKYPIHTGMQHGVILEAEPRGLPLTEKLMPQHLANLNYVSHAIGKWHLGFYKKEYTPEYRGFKSHYGYWNGYHDYYNHIVQSSFSPFEGYDMRRGNQVDWSSYGKYSTDLFTDESVRIIKNHNNSQPLFLYLSHLAVHSATYYEPLQAPKDVIKKFSHYADIEQRKLAAMIYKLDESVGKVITALKEANMLQNSIIVFVSDNGAPTEGVYSNRGSNWPLKGEKSTQWEGGIRTVALVWSPMIIGQKVSNALMHITDWLPTLYSAAGGDIKDLGNIDGINQWDYFTGIGESKRNEILHNIDDTNAYAAIRINNYKYVKGTVLFGFLDKWMGAYTGNRIKLYNTTAVLSSDVSNCLLSLNLNSSTLPTKEKIMQLRNASKVRCDVKKIKDCHSKKKPCVFNIVTDPCEMVNLFDDKNSVSNLVNKFELRLNLFKKTLVKASNLRPTKKADPKLYNNTWVSWCDYDDIKC